MALTLIDLAAQAKPASVTNPILASGAVLDANIGAAAAVQFSKLAALPSANLLLGSAGNVATATALSGDAALTNGGILTISAAAVTGAKIAAATITGANIAAATVTDANLSVLYLKADGTRALTGNLSAGGFSITSLASPVNPGDATTKSYVDAFINGATWKSAARLATTTALPANTYANGTGGVGATLTATANAALSVDGLAVAVNDRILVKNEAAPANNGVYVVTQTGSGVAPYILTRSVDANSSTTLTSGDAIFTADGTTLVDTGWIITTVGSITVGTTAINWTQFTSLGQVIAGSGLLKTGNTLSVVSGNGISVGAGVSVLADAIGGANLALAINVSTNGLAVKIDNSTIQANGSNQLIVNGANVAGVNAAQLGGLTNASFLRSDANSSLNNTFTLTAASGATLSLSAGSIFNLNGTWNLGGTAVAATSAQLNALGTIVVRETAAGTINGTNVTFTLANTPKVGSEEIFLNGILQEAGVGNDYTISGLTVTLAAAPATGSRVKANYRY